jgi:hypothetical protein
MNGLAEFVSGGFPLPQNPVKFPWATGVSMGEFVLGGFPLPQNPVGFRASVNGSLPKAPPIPMALIGHGNGAELDDCGTGMGCGCGGSCGGCGMGAFDLASIENLIPGQTFGVKNAYLVGGVIAAFLILPMLMGGTSRRRR